MLEFLPRQYGIELFEMLRTWLTNQLGVSDTTASVIIGIAAILFIVLMVVGAAIFSDHMNKEEQKRIDAENEAIAAANAAAEAQRNTIAITTTHKDEE